MSAAQAFSGRSVPETYQRHLVPVIFASWARILINAAGVAPGDRVLDVAAGTGVAARAAALHAGPAGHVVATDVSNAMLDVARSLPLEHGGAHIEYLQADAAALPCPDSSFDIALCNHGLQFMRDRPPAIREMFRVLRPGGCAAATVWAAGHRLEPFDDYADTLVACTVTPPHPRAFDNSALSLSADQVRRLLADGGFTAIEVNTSHMDIAFPDAGSAAEGIMGTPFGPVLDELSSEERAAVDAELARRLRPETPEGTVRRRTVALVARGRKPSR